MLTTDDACSRFAHVHAWCKILNHRNENLYGENNDLVCSAGSLITVLTMETCVTRSNVNQMRLNEKMENALLYYVYMDLYGVRNVLLDPLNAYSKNVFYASLHLLI